MKSIGKVSEKWKALEKWKAPEKWKALEKWKAYEKHAWKVKSTWKAHLKSEMQMKITWKVKSTWKAHLKSEKHMKSTWKVKSTWKAPDWKVKSTWKAHLTGEKHMKSTLKVKSTWKTCAPHAFPLTRSKWEICVQFSCFYSQNFIWKAPVFERPLARNCNPMFTSFEDALPISCLFCRKWGGRCSVMDSLHRWVQFWWSDNVAKNSFVAYYVYSSERSDRMVTMAVPLVELWK